MAHLLILLHRSTLINWPNTLPFQHISLFPADIFPLQPPVGKKIPSSEFSKTSYKLLSSVHYVIFKWHAIVLQWKYSCVVNLLLHFMPCAFRLCLWFFTVLCILCMVVREGLCVTCMMCVTHTLITLNLGRRPPHPTHRTMAIHWQCHSWWSSYVSDQYDRLRAAPCCTFCCRKSFSGNVQISTQQWLSDFKFHNWSLLCIVWTFINCV